MRECLSIDQNSHSLWDTLPKLQALALHGYAVRHCVEDLDVAFTSLGAEAGGGPLRLERERFHHSGGASWGAGLFYTPFLGRQPVAIRDWEPYTGQSTRASAKILGVNEADLFDEYSAGDTWQLTGPSFAADRLHHRALGDLSVRETAPFLRELLEKAEADTRRAFPAPDAQARAADWFARERKLVEELSARRAAGRLVEVYADWLRARLGTASVELDRASNFFALDARPEQTRLLELFTRDYERAAALFNAALEETNLGLRPLRLSEGELPFFALLFRDGRWLRAGAALRGGGLAVGEDRFALLSGGRLPLSALSDRGVVALSGKAILLILQARTGEQGRALALPYRGSMYVPAAHRLETGLRSAGLLTEPLKPLLRVRFRLLDRLGELDTPVGLPPHLAGAFGGEVVAARRFGAAWGEAAAGAAQRLESLKTPAGRAACEERAAPDLAARARGLEARKRARAEAGAEYAELRALWEELREVRRGLLRAMLRSLAADWQLRDLDYYDSRGAPAPWCFAAGGEAFYQRVLAGAEVYAEKEEGR